MGKPTVNVDDISTASIRNLLKSRGVFCNVNESREVLIGKLIKADKNTNYETTATIALRKKLMALPDEKLIMCMQRYGLYHDDTLERSKHVNQIINYVHSKRAANVSNNKAESSNSNRGAPILQSQRTKTGDSFSYPMRAPQLPHIQMPTKSPPPVEESEEGEEEGVEEEFKGLSIHRKRELEALPQLNKAVSERSTEEQQELMDQESQILTNLKSLPLAKIQSLCSEKYKIQYKETDSKAGLIIKLMGKLRELRMEQEEKAQQEQEMQQRILGEKTSGFGMGFSPMAQAATNATRTPSPPPSVPGAKVTGAGAAMMAAINTKKDITQAPISRGQGKREVNKYNKTGEQDSNITRVNNNVITGGGSDSDDSDNGSDGAPQVFSDPGKNYRVIQDGNIKVTEMVSDNKESGMSQRELLLSSRVNGLSSTEIKNNLDKFKVGYDDDIKRSELASLLIDTLKTKPQRLWPKPAQ